MTAPTPAAATSNSVTAMVQRADPQHRHQAGRSEEFPVQQAEHGGRQRRRPRRTATPAGTGGPSRGQPARSAAATPSSTRPSPRRRTSCRTSARSWPRPAGSGRRRRTAPCRRSGPAGTARAAAVRPVTAWAAHARRVGQRHHGAAGLGQRGPPRRSPGRPGSSRPAPRRRTAAPRWRRRPRAGPPRPAGRSGPPARARRNRGGDADRARHRSPGGRRAAACAPPRRLVAGSPGRGRRGALASPPASPNSTAAASATRTSTSRSDSSAATSATRFIRAGATASSQLIVGLQRFPAPRGDLQRSPDPPRVAGHGGDRTEDRAAVQAGRTQQPQAVPLHPGQPRLLCPP